MSVFSGRIMSLDPIWVSSTLFLNSLWSFLNRLDSEDEVLIETKGSLEAVRAFCYVDDIVRGLTLLSEKNSGVNVYNIGNTQRVKMSRIIG
jgi:nucleoside-diphosphate-sugar epimerase